MLKFGFIILLFQLVNIQAQSADLIVPAVEDINREYNFLKVIKSELKLPFLKYQNGPYTSIQVNGSTSLCSTNFKQLDMKTFSALFDHSDNFAGLKSGNYDVTKAYGYINHFGSECLEGHYEDDPGADSNGPQQVFVCDKATEPTHSRIYVTIKFKTNLAQSYNYDESFLYCVKTVPYNSGESLTIHEIEADVRSLGFQLKN